MTLPTPATDWQEVIAPDEGERFERYAKVLQQQQQKRAQKGAPLRRALHAKQLRGVRGEFTILPELPEFARVGLFATPATFPAWVRFSNGNGATQSDHKSDIRGLAIKLIGAPGRKLIPGMEEAKTQDFLLINSPAISFRDAAEFMYFATNAGQPLTLLPKLIWHFGAGRTLGILRSFKANFGAKVPTLAGVHYFSALPIKYGPYAVHYSVKPSVVPSPEVSLGTAPAERADYLMDDLETRLGQGRLAYDFRVQFYRDGQRTPIEDASVPWQEADAPFVTVARLVLPKQDLRGPEGQRITDYVERLSFDPWHAAQEFRPLGNIMRARNVAYRVSTQTRQAAKEPEDDSLP